MSMQLSSSTLPPLNKGPMLSQTPQIKKKSANELATLTSGISRNKKAGWSNIRSFVKRDLPRFDSSNPKGIESIL